MPRGRLPEHRRSGVAVVVGADWLRKTAGGVSWRPSPPQGPGRAQPGAAEFVDAGPGPGPVADPGAGKVDHGVGALQGGIVDAARCGVPLELGGCGGRPPDQRADVVPGAAQGAEMAVPISPEAPATMIRMIHLTMPGTAGIPPGREGPS